jgi:transcriptional regulator with XRE-family HTH domain
VEKGRYPKSAQAIKTARKQRGWSQEYAASIVGCTRLQWIRWEQGVHQPVSYADRLSEVLGIPKEQLKDDEDEEEAALADLGRTLVAALDRFKSEVRA